MKLIEPPVTPATEPFWEATRDRRLLLQWCTACDEVVFYPREVCPRCLSDGLEWREASGLGTVYAVSVQHRTAPGRDPDDGPYAVALVDLVEGARVMTNVVGCEPDSVHVDQAVQVHWHELSDGRNLPMFTPVALSRVPGPPRDRPDESTARSSGANVGGPARDEGA